MAQARPDPAALTSRRPLASLAPPAEPVLADTAVRVELIAIVMAVRADEPMIRLSETGDRIGLPVVAYDPRTGGTLEATLRRGVEQATGVRLGHVEQLQAETAAETCARPDVVDRLSIGYLALTHEDKVSAAQARGSGWYSWYRFFPWEDWRRGRPAILAQVIEPRLSAWAASPQSDSEQRLRHERICVCFGCDGTGWDEEKVVERNELLEEADLLETALATPLPGRNGNGAERLTLSPGQRHCLAAAMGRLRARIKSKPLVFDLMPELFTLFELQRAVEAILGPHLHKQNFRRLVEHMGLVEPTSSVKTHTGGRPAKLFRFRHSVVLERTQPGVRVRGARL